MNPSQRAAAASRRRARRKDRPGSYAMPGALHGRDCACVPQMCSPVDLVTPCPRCWVASPCTSSSVTLETDVPVGSTLDLWHECPTCGEHFTVRMLVG